jgi:hypothetical protein
MVPPLSQTVKAGTRDTRETTVMVLVGLVVMRISKMGNLVRIGKLGSYLFLQIVYFFQIFFDVFCITNMNCFLKHYLNRIEFK